MKTTEKSNIILIRSRIEHVFKELRDYGYRIYNYYSLIDIVNGKAPLTKEECNDFIDKNYADLEVLKLATVIETDAPQDFAVELQKKIIKDPNIKDVYNFTEIQEGELDSEVD